ncbi:hypothetical protein HON36_04990 [Candidatus Parcubacteria bacterium]|jgi:hypothetical protein|nr:hypothetical protein [Candidatus Parcubacteria bacterium]MBT7228387.1 hypothetical protein [Candidatus Parcubacteria bacterium]
MSRIIITIFILLLIPISGHAGFLDDISCINNGQCGLDSIVKGFVNLTRLMLGSMGAFALLYFVWGGIQWLTSGGNADRVNKGRQIMINTFWALVIAFGSFILLDFFVNDVLGVKDEYQITSVCSNPTTSKGTACNQTVGSPGNSFYMCTGHGYEGALEVYNGKCRSRCEVKGLDDEIYQTPFVCRHISSFGGAIPANAASSLCPEGSDFLCVPPS